MKNKLIIVDQVDQIIGYKSKEDCHKGEGILHRAFSIFIFNDQKELLIQRRSSVKPLWPLYWSNSVCSHPCKGEDCEAAAHRRLTEELGISTTLNFLYKFQYQARYDETGSENELCSVFIGKANGVVRNDISEIADWKYINPDDLDREINSNSENFTPWFRMEWARIRKDFKEEINSLLKTKIFNGQ